MDGEALPVPGKQVKDEAPNVSRETAAAWSCWSHAAAAVGILAFYLFATLTELHSLPLMDPDEPRYAGAARSMTEGGSWLTPEWNGAPRINKPPLFYWLVAASQSLCGGASEFSARLPSVLMGLVVLAFTVLLGARLYGAGIGWLGGLILCLSPLFLGLSRTCILDQTFMVFLMTAFSCQLLALAGRWPWPRLNPLWPTGLSLGLAFLTKGTPMLLGLLTPLVYFLAATHGSRLQSLARLMRSRTFWGALALMLALGGWWHVFLAAKFGLSEWARLFGMEVLGRVAGEVHRAPFYYFPLVLPVLFFPWSLGLPAAIASAWRRSPAALPLSSAPGETPPAQVREVADGFLNAWLMVTVLFFTVPGAKLSHYLLPCFPAAALLTARLLARFSGRGQPVSRALWIAALLPALLSAHALPLVWLGMEAGVVRWSETGTAYVAQIPFPLWVAVLALEVLVCLPWLAAVARRRLAFLLAPVAALFLICVFSAPKLGREFFESLSLRSLCRAPEVAARARTAERLIVWGCRLESLHYYLRRKIEEIERPGPLTRPDPFPVILQDLKEAHPPGQVLIFTKERHVANVLGGVPGDYRILAKQGETVVLASEPELPP